MRNIINSGSLNIALHDGRRFFSLTGPRGSGKLRKLVHMVNQVQSRTTIPTFEDESGNLVPLIDQLRSGLMTSGSKDGFGFVLLNVQKGHFDALTQKQWNDSERVRYAYYALIGETMQACSMFRLPHRTAVIFNFDDAPFSPEMSLSAIDSL